MPAPGGESREELYANWVAWATTNLGGNPTLIEAAANAAADTAFRGDGLEAATNAARKAWFANAQADESSWRPGFWKLLLSNPFVWALPALLLVIVVSAFQHPVSGVALVALMLLPIALIIVIWQVGSNALLSLGGTVAAGSLVNVIKNFSSGPRGGGTTTYTAVYEFAFQGQKRTASHEYYVQDSIRQDVMVLFYPRFPGFCRVLPELLKPGST
jgi:hypothetical protein